MARIYKLFELLFTTKQTGKYVNEYLATKKALLLQYHPVTTNLKEVQRQKGEFYVVLIPLGLDPVFKPYKAGIFAGQEFTLRNNIFGP